MSQHNLAWVSYCTIVGREVHRFMRLWTQTILPSVMTMALYFIVFGSFVGKRIGLMHGFDYALFITPGLVMMAVITNSYLNTSTSFYLNKFQRSIEELLVAPLSNNVIILGYLTGGVLRGLINGICVVGVSLLFTQLYIHHIAMMLLVIIATSMIFSLGGLINAIYADDFDDIAFVPTFVLTPLTYLGAVFYTLESLPPFWQKMSLFNPILYLVNLFRYGMLGYSDINVVTSSVVMILCVVVLYLYALGLLRRGTGLRT